MSVYIDGVNNNLNDTNNVALLGLDETASAVNNLAVKNAATGGAPRISAEGSDTNIDVEVRGKGAGHLVVPAGTPGTTATNARVGGVLNTQHTAVGNTADTNEDTLMTYTVPANVLGASGDSLHVEAWGDFTNSANTKRLKLKYGSTTLIDSTALAFNTTTRCWRIIADIIRTGAATQVANAVLLVGDTLLSLLTANTSPTETLSGPVALTATGQCNAATANEIRQLGMRVEWRPG